MAGVACIDLFTSIEVLKNTYIYYTLSVQLIHSQILFDISMIIIDYNHHGKLFFERSVFHLDDYIMSYQPITIFVLILHLNVLLKYLQSDQKLDDRCSAL